MPEIVPSSSTPRRTLPPSRFANPTSSLASASGSTTSRLNSTPELSPFRSSSRSSVLVISEPVLLPAALEGIFAALEQLPDERLHLGRVNAAHVLGRKVAADLA